MEINVLLLIVLLPLIIGTSLSWWVERYSRLYSCLIATGISLSCFAALLLTSSLNSLGQPLLQQWQWLPEIGLNLSFRLDGLALIFGMLISGIGTLICIYAWYYLSPKNSLGKLYSLLMLFMAAMLGLVLSNNLLLLVVFWELTSISSFLLVGYWQNKKDAQQGALMALTITGMGGLALLGGVVLLGYTAGSYELDVLLGMRDQVQSSPYFNLALALILLGAFSKSAQFPFHFWLPNAMAAPTPVSAYLHSATMVKAGIFLIARLFPLLAGSIWFHGVVTAVGLLTLCFAAFIAIFKHDLKGLLAYSTSSHLGLIMCLLGIGTPLAVAAAIFHVLNHASFKAALFMIAGMIDHEAGTRDLRQLGGLWSLLPWTATLAMIAAAAMGGVPLTNGFLSKEMFLTEVLALSGSTWLLLVPILATLAGAFALTYSIRLVHNTFFGGFNPHISHKNIHEPPPGMRLPVILLCSICLLVGIAPALFAQAIVQIGTNAVLGYVPATPVHLALWHGINLPLTMSIIALTGGALLYVYLIKDQKILHIHSERWFGVYTGGQIFTILLQRSIAGARTFIANTENGSLQRYLVWIIATTLVVATVPLWGENLSTGSRLLNHASWIAIILWVLLLISCFMLLYFHHERIKAVLLVGAVGLVAAMVFIGMSAPDLALTQISVDVVSTVLLLMSLSLLPQLSPYESSPSRHWRDVVIALASGGAIAWIAWLILTRDHQSIAWFFVQEALPAGGGTNVVNVILVDFRGFDTFGEICVLAIAAVGALVMMDGMRAHGAIATPGLTLRFNPSPLMLRMTASWVLPIALLYSLYILMRGHNLPGGGFIAGLITAIALIIQYIAIGQEHAEQLIHAKRGRLYEYWIGGGLSLAGLTGLGSLFWQRPFLTSAHIELAVPVVGTVPLASAMLFDIGVFLTVAGSTLLLISVLGDSRHSTLSGPVVPPGKIP
ncbi:monovalent cation/H+ antiporter subunit A [Alkanindiges sp. WGS2144]|uniref:monovalent cation/H+ antiporter subunit A n=1 Tax=Alkanindiges sp. WGS2144 TaxID=3366808 RepID=UPI003751CDBA